MANQGFQTFMISNEGLVYGKDLGINTAILHTR